MVEQLLENVKNTFGKPILKTKDCELLSEEISQKTNKYLSYNTLRRVFGIVIDKHVPRMSTLDILTEYIGYKSFVQFSEYQKETVYLDRMSICFKPTNLNIKSRLSSVQELQYSITLVSQLARENIILKNWKAFEDILAWLNEQNYDYESILYFGNSVGSLFRDNEFNLEEVKNNPLFFKYIFSIFVDYSSLNGYYGKLIDFYDKQNGLSENDLIFVRSMKIFKSFLFHDLGSDNQKNYAYDNQECLHPILNSRIIATKLMLSKSNAEIQEILIKYNTFLKNENQKISFEFYYEILLISLPIQNDIIFQWLGNQNLDKFSVTQHQHNYLNLWKLVKIHYSNSYMKNSVNELDFKPIDMLYMRNSYFEFINLFYLKIKKKYSVLSELDSGNLESLKLKLDYPFFK